jgi:hypothetical protein
MKGFEVLLQAGYSTTTRHVMAHLQDVNYQNPCYSYLYLCRDLAAAFQLGLKSHISRPSVLHPTLPKELPKNEALHQV